MHRIGACELSQAAAARSSVNRIPNETSSLDSVLASPLHGGRVVLGAVLLVDVGDLGHQRVVGVGVRQHGADGQKDFRNSKSRTPLVPQDVQADATVGVDIGVVNSGGEVDLRGLERVVCGEVDGQEEDAALVWRVGRSHDCRLPVEQVLADRAGGAGRWRITAEVREFLVDALQRHCVWMW